MPRIAPILLGCLCLLCSLSTIAQAQRTCGTDQYHQSMMSQSPKFAQQFKDNQKKIRAKAQANKTPTCSNTIVIPVAVHFNGGVTAANMPCLIDACLAQVEVMNQDFGSTNADISNYTDLSALCSSTYPLSALSNDACLEFCLAQYDHPITSIAEGDYAITVGQYSWPNAGTLWAGYMNIFVENGLGILGQAPVSGAANPNGNGFQILASAFGGPGISCTSGTGINTDGVYNLGRTATHEAGHYFGLQHVFAGCNNGDGIADTPNQSSSNFGCPSVNTSTCLSNANNTCSTQDYFFNYMDYVNDVCMYMFTADQAAVMFATADHNSWGDDAVKCFSDPNACDITDVSVILNACMMNGTPQDDTDDTFTFSVQPIGVNLGSTYSISGDISINFLPYGMPITFDNNGAGYMIADGGLSLTITDDTDSSCSFTVVVDPPATCAIPIANFTPSSDLSVCANSPNVMFMDISQNSPDDWTWSISGPDASVVSDSGPVFTVAINAAGTYTVTLTASNMNGSDTFSADIVVTQLPAEDSACSNCDYTLVMWDRRANGWAASQSLTVSIDGTSTTYTGPPSGSLSQSVTLSLDTGNNVDITATVGNPGAASQMSWRLFDEQGYVALGDGDTFGIGPGNFQGSNAPILDPPLGGVTYSHVVDCGIISPCNTYTLNLTLDNFPDETAWQLLDANGDYVYQSLGYDGLGGTTQTSTFCLTDGCYDFLMIDYFGDGICCSEGNGSYELLDPDGNIVASGSTFTGIESTNFCVSIPESCPDNLTLTNAITSDVYVADLTLEADGSISPSEIVEFYGGQTICLQSGFEVVLGAEFSAENLDCTTYSSALVIDQNSFLVKEFSDTNASLEVYDRKGCLIPLTKILDNTLPIDQQKYSLPLSSETIYMLRKIDNSGKTTIEMLTL